MDEGADPDNPKGQRGSNSPVVVAIGASAGGVQALQALFDALPADSGAAYVVVMHLDPERHSELPSVLAARTKMTVAQVENSARLKPDHIYVIPPDCSLQLVDHEITAVPFEEPRGRRSPIDSFFRSMSERLGDGFAVILSGAGSDGEIGVRAVKESGGIILVQEPDEAEYGSMPRAAIASGVVDFVLPVRELANRLIELVRLKSTTPPTAAAPLDAEVLRRVLAHLRVRTGHDFSKYKQSTVLRRVARRMQVTRAVTLSDYYECLRDNADEAQALLSDLLISVTTFFRDSHAFETLARTVLPRLIKDRAADEPVRVWVCGCATGEEAYSIAILMLEAASQQGVRPPIQIFGTDLDARALATAREGRYPAAIESDVGEERLRRFFTREADHYRVREEVRDTILFAAHDMLKDPPFSHVDLISCRNVLIYLDRELQEQLCSTFYYALNPAGFLLLGSSETADNPPGLFRGLDRQARLYQSTSKVGEKPRLLPRLLGPVRVQDQVMPLARGVSAANALSEAALHRRAIEQVAPPSLLVDENHQVVHVSDSAGRYLMPPGGPLTGDAADLARPELRFEVRSALNRVFEQNQATLSLPIMVRFNGHPHRVLMLVKPAQNHDGPRHALVMFIEGEAVDNSLLTPDRHTSDETIRRLSQELELTQERLRTVREESDAANEELRAANEELQSINEEYRSTSEELETSKEELQSINEELQTVNTELKLKLEAISRAHSDLQNLMAATDFGTLFLDSSLRIKRFTDHVTDLFSVTKADEGRPITDFAHQLEYDDLIKDARSVLSNLSPIRREVASRSGRWFDVRFRPYRTLDDRIDGVVITFVDITDRRRMEEALRTSEQNLLRDKQMIELSREPMLVWDVEGNILQWNFGCQELYGYSAEEALGQKKHLLLRTVVPGSSIDAMKSALLENGTWSGELGHFTKDGRELAVEARIELVDLDGRRLFFESTRDVTERKQLERRQELLLGELAHRIKNLLVVVQAIAHQTLRTSKTNKDFVERFDGRLAALGTAHSLLVESQWEGASLAALAKEQLDSYVAEQPDRLQLAGPPLVLPADLATPFGLVLHELATNSAKYGSLSAPRGKVLLRWELDSRNDPPRLKFTWEEQGGPAVTEPKRKGFGTSLIQEGLPHARVERNFRPEGLVCHIELGLPPVTNVQPEQ